MDDNAIVELVKMDLQISSQQRDALLKPLISSAKKQIEQIGITLNTNDDADCMLIVAYTACLYRQRSNLTAAIPRMLQRMLNDRLFNEKGG